MDPYLVRLLSRDIPSEADSDDEEDGGVAVPGFGDDLAAAGGGNVPLGAGFLHFFFCICP